MEEHVPDTKPDDKPSEKPAGTDDKLQGEDKPEEKPADDKTGQDDEFKSEGSKRAVLADLAKERGHRKELEQRLNKLAPLEQLAVALGNGKPDGPTDVESLTQRIAKHEQDLATEREARWRAEVAHEKGLTADQAAELRGTTRDELVSHADRLLSLFPTGTGKALVVPRSGTGGGAPATGSVAAGKDMYKPRAKQT